MLTVWNAWCKGVGEVAEAVDKSLVHADPRDSFVRNEENVSLCSNTSTRYRLSKESRINLQYL